MYSRPVFITAPWPSSIIDRIIGGRFTAPLPGPFDTQLIENHEESDGRKYRDFSIHRYG